MITVSINTGNFDLAEKFKRFISPEGQGNLLRALTVSMLPVVHDRIHERGEDAAGGQIGTYSPSYLKYTRPKYNRSNDPKVILSLTRQMENDFSAVAESDRYGLGFKNPLNFDKATWLEGTYKKKIYALQDKERDLAITLGQEYTDALFK